MTTDAVCLHQGTAHWGCLWLGSGTLYLLDGSFSGSKSDLSRIMYDKYH